MWLVALKAPLDPAVVVTNAGDYYSRETFAAFVAELLAGPEPELDSLDTAAVSRELRADAGA